MEIAQRAIERWSTNDLLDYTTPCPYFKDYTNRQIISFHFVFISIQIQAALKIQHWFFRKLLDKNEQSKDSVMVIPTKQKEKRKRKSRKDRMGEKAKENIIVPENNSLIKTINNKGEPVIIEILKHPFK